GPARRRASLVGAGDEPHQLDAGAPSRRDRRAGGRGDLEIAALQGATEKRGFRYRRPRHTLKGRQDAEAVDRGGLRVKLFKAQAEAGDIVLLFADESEALTHRRPRRRNRHARISSWPSSPIACTSRCPPGSARWPPASPRGPCSTSSPPSRCSTSTSPPPTAER